MGVYINFKMSNPNINTNQDIINRLNRISGQITGITKMVEKERDCVSIIQQIMAVRSALAKTATKILTRQSCKLEMGKDPHTFEELLNQLLNFN